MSLGSVICSTFICSISLNFIAVALTADYEAKEIELRQVSTDQS